MEALNKEDTMQPKFVSIASRIILNGPCRDHRKWKRLFHQCHDANVRKGWENSPEIGKHADSSARKCSRAGIPTSV